MISHADDPVDQLEADASAMKQASQPMRYNVLHQRLLRQQVRHEHTSTSKVKFTELLSLLQSILPPAERDVPFMYHRPGEDYDLDSANVSRLVLSVAPTRGVYKTFYLPKRDGLDVYFLHRPFDLKRHKSAAIWRRPRAVLSSHKVFDELLTVGWNTALAERLGLGVEKSVCVRGYNTDLERRIGLLAPFVASVRDAQAIDDRSWCQQQDEPALTMTNRDSTVVLKTIREQFGTVERTVGFDEGSTPDASLHGQDSDEPLRGIAIMNAFRRIEVERIAAMAAESGLVTSVASCSGLLYLTGQAREDGIEAAMECGMKVVCVGHRTCEDWGVRYLMSSVQSRFPDLEVRLVDEPEEPRIRRNGNSIQVKPNGVRAATNVDGSLVEPPANHYGASGVS